MRETFTLQIGLDDPDLHDIFTTAIEGGCTYWARITGYRWRLPGTDEADLLTFKATIEDTEDDDKEYVITRQTIVQGIQRALDGAFTYGSQPATPEMIAGMRRVISALDVDASAADNILQIALFGDVRYG
jgi:hypothetical protein